MFRFSFITSVGEHATFSLKAKNYNEGLEKALVWCEKAKCTFRTITRINK